MSTAILGRRSPEWHLEEVTQFRFLRGKVSCVVRIGGSANRDLLDDFERAFSAMNTANIAIYPVNLRGIGSSTPGGSQLNINGTVRAQPAASYADDPTFGIKVLADKRAGRPVLQAIGESQMPAYHAYPASGDAEPRPLPNRLRLSAIVRRVMYLTFL